MDTHQVYLIGMCILLSTLCLRLNATSTSMPAVCNGTGQAYGVHVCSQAVTFLLTWLFKIHPIFCLVLVYVLSTCPADVCKPKRVPSMHIMSSHMHS